MNRVIGKRADLVGYANRSPARVKPGSNGVHRMMNVYGEVEQTAGGKQLSTDQVQTVVNLVASSVEGLDPEDVTVADAAGTVLAAPGQTGAGASGGREQQTSAFEQRMSNSVQQMVTQLVGANHAVVRITADLDFDQAETKSQTYSSDPNADPLKESTTNETYNGTGGAGAGGILGQINGTDGGAGGNGTYQQQKEVRDNAVNSVIETRKSAPGKVRKLGVAVLIDENAARNVDMGAVENLARSAVGLDTTRGQLSAMYIQHEAIEAQKSMVNSPNHTVVYIPVGSMGVPVTGTFSTTQR